MQQKDFQRYAFALNESSDHHPEQHITNAIINHDFDEFRKSDSQRMQCAFSRHCGLGFSFMVAIDNTTEKDGSVMVEWRLVPAHLAPEIPAFYPVQELRKAMEGHHIIQRIDSGVSAVAIINRVIKELSDDDIGAVVWCVDGEPPKEIDLPVIWCKEKKYPKID
mgnify:CR=1 FL=1